MQGATCEVLLYTNKFILRFEALARLLRAGCFSALHRRSPRAILARFVVAITLTCARYRPPQTVPGSRERRRPHHSATPHGSPDHTLECETIVYIFIMHCFVGEQPVMLHCSNVRHRPRAPTTP